jgi:Right handed beta helix region
MVPEGSDHVLLSGIEFEGTGEQNAVKIYTADVTVQDSELTTGGRGYSCMMLGRGAVRTIVQRNRFHDCGRPGSNKNHAIYASHAVGARIWGNVFWSHAGRAVQLYPDAQRNLVSHNVIDGGLPSIRGGIVVGSDEGHTSNGNIIEYNIIAYAETYSIYTNWNDGAGSGNVARFNCFWAAKSGHIDADGGGLAHYGNSERQPLFVSRASRDYRLQPSSKCRDVVGFDAAEQIPSLRG